MERSTQSDTIRRAAHHDHRGDQTSPDSDSPTRELVVRWGDTQMPGTFASYHIWVTGVTSNRWRIRDNLNDVIKVCQSAEEPNFDVTDMIGKVKAALAVLK